jgi:peptidoglycan/xylan/chitin deacetylase (PgdA/CDA1 family)
MKRLLFLLFGCAIACTLLTTCKKIPMGRLPDGYIALTFDDSSISNWYENLPELESNNIRATFYISCYHGLSASDKQLLKKIRDRGHEIAYHTTNHKDLYKLLYSSRPGWDKVYEEVNTDLDLMRRDGFQITDFAYPFGKHDENLDRELLKIFKTVRAVTNKTNSFRCLAKEAGCEKQVLYAAHVDVKTFLSNDDLAFLLSKAKERKTCAVLGAHQINRPASHYQIDSYKIKLIADMAKQLNLQFITVDQLH